MVPNCYRDGCGEDEGTTEPGERAQMVAEQLDAEDRTERGLDIEKDAGA